MPWPVIAAGAAALLAGGSKVAAMAANSRAARIASSVATTEAKARAKNEQFRGAREECARIFSADADRARSELKDYLASQQISKSEIAATVLPPDVRKGLGDLSISPPPVIDLKRCTSGDAMLQSSAKVMVQGQNLQRSHPKMGGAMQTVALVGAVTGYIGGNIERVQRVDAYEGKARQYIAEVEGLVASFDSAFEKDVAEDRRTAERVGDYVRGLFRRVYKSSQGDRGLVVAYAVAFSNYVDYLEGLVSRYRFHPEGGS
jgi:hypothetical protein